MQRERGQHQRILAVEQRRATEKRRGAAAFFARRRDAGLRGAAAAVNVARYDMYQLIDILRHLDKYLETYAHQYGVWIYALLFLIVFCETGLVVTPFLPGDSMLFAVGALAAAGVLHIWVAVPLFVVASSCGDNTNYWIGRWIGPRAFHFPKSLIFNPAYLQKAHQFYQRYGSRMMAFSRFLPMIRTFAPFAAGVAAMDYRKFLLFDSIGALCWGSSITLLGYWFGNHAAVRSNFSLVIVGIIVISLLPVGVEAWRAWRARRRA
ncbi:MAG: VTT domain-containing protein [Verrucomicrobiales bacterium]|nr:VTT domain-containing protein [Verrucomicrobiales bacterium]